MTTRSFDADARTAELLEAPVTIGARLFHAARLTPDVRRDQLRIATRGAKNARKFGLDSDGDVKDLTDEQLDERVEAVGEIDQGLYEQLSVLLVDEQALSPPVAFLVQELDNRVAQKLLAWLLEDDDAGESQPATIPLVT